MTGVFDRSDLVCVTLRPFWRYFGAKWRAAPFYPAPRHTTIIEPFAGAAGYSLRHAERAVILVERDPRVAEVWRWLIGSSPADLRAIPLVECVDDLPAATPEGARLLVGFGFGAGDSRPRRRMSPMIRRDGGWPRERLASQVAAIKHWRIIEGDYTEAPDLEATYFVDPPYQIAGARDTRPGARGRVRYPHGADAIDFMALGQWCRTRQGQVIACENVGATWLPFEPLRDFQSARPGGVSREAVWLGGVAVGDQVEPDGMRPRCADNPDDA